MHADHHYEIGSSHAACEDYAMSGTHNGLSYAIVSDGCSSSDDTDVGARILCHIAKSALLYLHRQGPLTNDYYIQNQFPSVFKSLVLMKAIEARASLRLDYNAFDATLLVAFAAERPDNDPAWGYICFGDGVTVLRYTDGHARAMRMSYSSNAPYYLSYGMSKDKDDAYRAALGDATRHNTFIDLFPHGKYEEVKDYECEPCTDYTHMASSDVMLDVPDQIVLFSDGVGSYEDKDRNAAPDMGVVREALSYKNTAGEFVKRRMRAMGKKFAADGISHYDDMSCAAVHIGGPRVEGL